MLQLNRNKRVSIMKFQVIVILWVFTLESAAWLQLWGLKLHVDFTPYDLIYMFSICIKCSIGHVFDLLQMSAFHFIFALHTKYNIIRYCILHTTWYNDEQTHFTLLCNDKINTSICARLHPQTQFSVWLLKCATFESFFF